MSCSHIPEKLTNTFGDYTEYENAVYQVFLNTFSGKQFSYEGKPIYEKKHPLVSGKSGTFWHIISSGDNEASKLPDFDRYETVGWPGFILEYCLAQCNNRLIWEVKKHTSTRVHIYCPDIEYVVVLDKRDGFYIFWIAFPVKYGHTKRRFLKEYHDYLSRRDLD